jgi:hypothetical protein
MKFLSQFKSHLPIVAALALLLGVPAIPGGCSSESIESYPEFKRAKEVAHAIEVIRRDGVDAREEAELVVLLADFNKVAADLESKLDARAAEIKASAESAKDAAAPLVPPPFNLLLDPAVMAALYFYLRKQGKSELEALKQQVLGTGPGSRASDK